MAEILPLLDAAEFVFRYAWMSARDSNGLRGLVEQKTGENGQVQLTKLGQLYNAI
jgi:hypothetical protein